MTYILAFSSEPRVCPKAELSGFSHYTQASKRSLVRSYPLQQLFIEQILEENVIMQITDMSRSISAEQSWCRVGCGGGSCNI